MGLFNNKKPAALVDGTEILESYDRGEIGADNFIREFGMATVYYTTPFGNHVDGGTRLFLMPGPDRTGYYPVFVSLDHMKEHYKKAGRAAYMIIEGTFASFLDVVKRTNDGGAPIKMGVIIEPSYSGTTIDVPFLDTAISLSHGKK